MMSSSLFGGLWSVSVVTMVNMSMACPQLRHTSTSTSTSLPFKAVIAPKRPPVRHSPSPPCLRHQSLPLPLFFSHFFSAVVGLPLPLPLPHTTYSAGSSTSLRSRSHFIHSELPVQYCTFHSITLYFCHGFALDVWSASFPITPSNYIRSCLPSTTPLPSHFLLYPPLRSSTFLSSNLSFTITSTPTKSWRRYRTLKTSCDMESRHALMPQPATPPPTSPTFMPSNSVTTTNSQSTTP